MFVIASTPYKSKTIIVILCGSFNCPACRQQYSQRHLLWKSPLCPIVLTHLLHDYRVARSQAGYTEKGYLGAVSSRRECLGTAKREPPTSTI